VEHSAVPFMTGSWRWDINSSTARANRGQVWRSAEALSFCPLAHSASSQIARKYAMRNRRSARHAIQSSDGGDKLGKTFAGDRSGHPVPHRIRR